MLPTSTNSKCSSTARHQAIFPPTTIDHDAHQQISQPSRSPSTTTASLLPHCCARHHRVPSSEHKTLSYALSGVSAGSSCPLEACYIPAHECNRRDHHRDLGYPRALVRHSGIKVGSTVTRHTANISPARIPADAIEIEIRKGSHDRMR